MKGRDSNAGRKDGRCQPEGIHIMAVKKEK